MRRPLSGLSAWLIQRLSAVFMLGFIAFMLVHFLVDPPHSYGAWRNWMTSPWASVGATLSVVNLSTHTWVGLRDVIIDYVRPVAVRLAALFLLALALSAMIGWAVVILFTVHG
jgi:succinate dehydrogenase / fumarate reductase membrane anchor subunit